MSESKYTPDLDDKIVDMFRDGSSITKVAAVKLGVHRDTYYHWKGIYPSFKKAAEHGEQLAEAFHEDRLSHGSTGDIEKFNVTAQIFTMKNRFRATYGEQQEKAASQTVIETLLGLLSDKDK
jgi:hypothetical protein